MTPGFNIKPYPVDTVIRFKKTGLFGKIKSVSLSIGGSLLHYLGEIEGKEGGGWYISPDEIDLECLPPDVDPKEFT